MWRKNGGTSLRSSPETSLGDSFHSAVGCLAEPSPVEFAGSGSGTHQLLSAKGRADMTAPGRYAQEPARVGYAKWPRTLSA